MDHNEGLITSFADLIQALNWQTLVQPTDRTMITDIELTFVGASPPSSIRLTEFSFGATGERAFAFVFTLLSLLRAFSNKKNKKQLHDFHFVKSLILTCTPFCSFLFYLSHSNLVYLLLFCFFIVFILALARVCVYFFLSSFETTLDLRAWLTLISSWWIKEVRGERALNQAVGSFDASNEFGWAIFLLDSQITAKDNVADLVKATPFFTRSEGSQRRCSIDYEEAVRSGWRKKTAKATSIDLLTTTLFWRANKPTLYTINKLRLIPSLNRYSLCTKKIIKQFAEHATSTQSIPKKKKKKKLWK